MRELLASEWATVAGGCGEPAQLTMGTDGELTFTQAGAPCRQTGIGGGGGGGGFGWYYGLGVGGSRILGSPSNTPFWIAQDHIDFPVPELDPVPPLMQFDVPRFDPVNPDPKLQQMERELERQLPGYDVHCEWSSSADVFPRSFLCEGEISITLSPNDPRLGRNDPGNYPCC